MWFSAEKVNLLLFVLVCFVLSLHYTYGKTSIIIKELVSPKHIGSREGVYAPTYRYGAPVSKYHIREAGGRTVRDIWKLRSRRENPVGNYASRYNTWSPYKEKLRLREPPIADVKPLGKRRRPVPPHPLKHPENDIIHPRRPGRPHKKRFNNLQRPAPPSDDDFDSEDYFPEESKRAEAQYDYRDGPRRPLKKRRNPVERKKKPKKPILYQGQYEDDDRRVVFDDDRKVLFNEERPDGPRYKPKRQPTISYSTFIQHSPPGPDVDYDYVDDEEVRHVQNQKKKRRIKKKTNKPRDEEEVEEYRLEKYPPGVTRYHPAYSAEDEYESQSVTKVKVKKYKPETQPVYGEGHISHQTQGPVYTPVTPPNFFRTSAHEDYIPSQQSQKVYTYNQASYPQTQTIVGSPQNYRPSYEANNFQSNTFSQSFSQPSGIQYNKITQPSQEYSNIYGYSNAHSNNYIPGSYTNAPVTTYESLTPSSSSYQKYRTYQDQQQSQDSPVYYSPSLSYSKDVATSFKSSPAYDSTDTFSSFNNNANSHKKYATYSSKYSENTGIIPSVKLSEGPDNESDFLQKHQNLYNNGISGVPVQGDGYMNKDGKKEYDIGYGEFQFDENPGR